MPSFLTSNSLIASVKRKENIPTSQVTFQDTDFLAFANDEMACALVPTVLALHEEFLVYEMDIPLVAGQLAYPIPYRAIGNKVRNVLFKDSNGNISDVARIDPAQLSYYLNSADTTRGYYFQNNSIVLLSTWAASSQGSLMVTYYMRPNQLVTEDRVGVITAIDRSTGNISFSGVPSNFTVAGRYDFLEQLGGHSTRAFDVPCNSVSSITKTLNFDVANIPSTLMVGDHIALAGECIIPQLPDELHTVLAQRVAARCLEALGDMQGLNAANTKLQEIEVKLGNVIDNRSDGNPQKIVNAKGLLRMGKLLRN